MSPDTDPSRDHTGPADSAGVPWEGRAFQPNPHAGDDGRADPQLLAALEAFGRGDGDERAVVDAYRSARLLIPLIAEKGDEGVGAHGLAVDKTQELSIVSVAAPDGRRVLPVFTSVETMTRWDAAARPVPADGVRTALAVAAEDTELIVIDPGSPTEFVLRRPAVWAIAQSQPWEPSYISPEVYAGLRESVGSELAVIDFSLTPGDPTARLRGPELIVELQLVQGLDRGELDAVLARLAKRWAADDRVAVLVDSLTIKLGRGA
ncbi:SseB family protein [Microbacterium sp. ET2]|uniref:SseB family protein n=1 Tax=Microbacterium albipurpureum TaxID=3050384 RepID=UPI00259CBF4A|nr:SseB family protein [Microbacterium sp. ET2 (Ac-2212)]WJL95307.1 SseB family protein [Microbacterium sp. ET2 (Ac-2212)]